jgi:sugar/nucleoside kinase (ribokinase family)
MSEQLERRRDMKKFDVITIGDVNVDIVVEGCDKEPEYGREMYVKDIASDVGGGAAICAMGTASLGLKTALCGILGNDPQSQYVLKLLKQYSVDTSFLTIAKQAKAGISIALFGEKDRSFITYPGTNNLFDIEKLDPKVFSCTRHVHITGYAGPKNHRQYVEFVRSLRKQGVSVSGDVGWDTTEKWDESIYEYINNLDLFFLNKTEALHYTRCSDVREALDLLSRHCSNVVIKLGPEGAIAKCGGRTAQEPTYDAAVVDTTGAGDSFNAGFLYGFLNHASLSACLKFGNACGTSSVAKKGGRLNFKSSEELNDFIAAHGGNGHPGEKRNDLSR